ncbi:AI-2E family transporter [Aromatoleum petrolei]|uniref:AI-2E family transporter n=1 Tax=Aromatoleum petrolei TaxID=76116 RepID=A0ABX1MV78_9RHOO|nr:AI-2E family transporter [Aromatoleum petrolei]NMF91131.1 AI-2E family transporter [Aromatoleum petrolei]QTQ35569.1 Putative transport protein [Aromatoleum petrolei]
MNPSRADRLQTAAWAGVALALVALFYALSPILAPFAIAAVFAYICDPAVNWMVARRIPRPAAVLLVILGAGLLLVLLFLILAPMIWREAIALIRRLPDLIELLNARVAPVLQARFDLDFQLDAAFVRTWIAEHWDSAQDLVPVILGQLRQGGLALAGAAASVFLVPVVMFYLLQEWPHILGGLQTVIPRPMLERTMRIINDIDRVLSEFLRGQLSVMLLLAVFYSVGLWIAGLKFALPVGVVTGLLVFIPYIGFGGGLLLAILSALLQAEGWPPLIGVAIVFGLGQLLESFVLTPYLVGERIGLHPLAVIFALMAFGQLFGFVGILVALPASAAILVGLREVRTAWLTSPVYLGAPPDDAPPQ